MSCSGQLKTRKKWPLKKKRGRKITIQIQAYSPIESVYLEKCTDPPFCIGCAFSPIFQILSLAIAIIINNTFFIGYVHRYFDYFQSNNNNNAFLYRLICLLFTLNSITFINNNKNNFFLFVSAVVVHRYFNYFKKKQ